MNSYDIQIEIADGKVKEILDRLTQAQCVIYDCYTELEHLGVLVIKRPPAATDG